MPPTGKTTTKNKLMGTPFTRHWMKDLYCSFSHYYFIYRFKLHFRISLLYKSPTEVSAMLCLYISEAYILDVCGRVGQLRVVGRAVLGGLGVPRARLLGLRLARQHALHVPRDQLGGGGGRLREDAQVADGHAHAQPARRRRDARHGDQRRRHQQELRFC